jgi:hypothetical protein
MQLHNVIHNIRAAREASLTNAIARNQASGDGRPAKYPKLSSRGSNASMTSQQARTGTTDTFADTDRQA